VSSSHAAAPSGDRLRGPLSRRSPTAKVVGLLAFLLVVGLTPNDRPSWLAAWLLVAVLAAAAAYVDWRAVARRLVIDAPLVVLAVAQALFGRGPDVTIGGLDLSRPGLENGAAVLAKATIGVVAVSAVAASTTVPETLVALRRIGLPDWFCTLVALAARQVDVLRAELARVRLATALRHPDGGRRAAWSVGARTLGLLFVRSTDRAERLQLAADLRGGDLAAVVAPVAEASR
jgi:cobalt/nickel transport system permease protein